MRAPSALGAALALAVTAACAVRVDTEHSDFDEYGDPRKTQRVETSLVSHERATLERAQALARDGQYGEAIALLEPLYAKQALDDALREDVLFSLGEMHGAWLNTHKDYDKALAYLRELVADYPATKHRERATEMMSTYEKALEQK